MRHLEDVGGEVDLLVEHHLLRRLLGFGGEQHDVLADACPHDERIVVRVGLGPRPASVGREDLEPHVADEDRPRRLEGGAPARPPPATASVSVSASGESLGHPGSRSDPTGIRDRTAGRPTMWSACGWLATTTSRRLMPSAASSVATSAGSGPPSTRIVAPPGDVSSAASPCPTSKKRTVSEVGGPAEIALDQTRSGASSHPEHERASRHAPPAPDPPGEQQHGERARPRASPHRRP